MRKAPMASHFPFTKLTVTLILSFFLQFTLTKSQRDVFNGTIHPNCAGTCGNITIPYPFGIGNECAHNSSFLISCNMMNLRKIPVLTIFDLQVIRITEYNIRVIIPPNRANLSNLLTVDTNNYDASFDWYMTGNCSQDSVCGSHAYCFHTGLNARIGCDCRRGYGGNPYLPNGCQDINECDLGYCGRCVDGRCDDGYSCINYVGGYSCNKRKNKTRIIAIGFGASLGGILLLVVLWWMIKVTMKIRKAKHKKKLFKRNGGLLLQQQLASGDDGTVNKTKLFTSKELDKATDHYNENRILGRGGQGTVYKGMLIDGRIVAIKMSKTVDEGNLEQFINEVVILSQINHRNVVKLHGCCLETEVPLLVYEFISNGTLSQYIHDQDEEFELSWDVRIRIATEVASALSYLHSAASFPIYHRDMKSSNILLDEKYRAKVADFGTSRSIALDQTHLTTRVLGTFGYLDPEYFQTGQFTEKSDVYSFGVVLVELLTGQQPISSSRPDESRSLATYFMNAMEENKLIQILDAKVEKNEMTLEVAKLAKRCLSSDVRKRPTMKEVAVALDGIRMSSSTKIIKVESFVQNDEHVKLHISGPLKSSSSMALSYEDNSVILDVQPLISR